MKSLPTILAALATLVFFYGGCRHYWSGSNVAPSALQEGDLVFQALPHNPLVDAIEGASGAPFSHCGIMHQTANGWVAQWKAQARDRLYVTYRLKPAYKEKIPAFIIAAQAMKGRPYDHHYAWDEEAIYCSELIYKAFEKATGDKLGTMQRLGDLNWRPYAAVMEQVEGGPVPVDRMMITPRAVTEAGQVELVRPQ
jgi:cell wall-associated NlpC family hydrolase